MSVSIYVLWFLLFSLFGWIYECIFCTIKRGHWENRGFLFGPICPIYGTGAVLVILIFGNVQIEAEELPLPAVFLICMVGSAILEYVTSYVLEKLFHAIWWDYSRMPFNINGRICLPASLAFGAVGTAIYHFVLPYVGVASISIPQVVAEPLALALSTLLGADLALTVSTLTTLVADLERIENEINEHAEEAFQSILEKKEAIVERKEALIEKKDAMLEKKDTLLDKKESMLEKKDAITTRGKAYEQQFTDNVRSFLELRSGREKRTLRRVSGFRRQKKENQFAKQAITLLRKK